MVKRKALGKGLAALIPEAENLEGGRGQHFFLCPIAAIEPSPYQPRQAFSEPELQSMAESVRENGILTPLLVTKTDQGYQLIAGERRWRAAQRAGLDRVPVVIRDVSGAEALQLALIENIHRKDLNAIEEALACKRLLEETGLTQEALAKRLGKDRTSITNLLRLLNLPQSIQRDVIDGSLSMGHARVLAGIKDPARQLALRDRVIQKGLSVRQLEDMAKTGKKRPALGIRDPYLSALSDDLKRSLGTQVEIRRRGKKGRIVIHFHSDEELDRLLQQFA